MAKIANLHISFKSFDDKLKNIIHKGDQTREYRDLFKKIVKYHREYWTEENAPTCINYLQELLGDAIIESYNKEFALTPMQIQFKESIVKQQKRFITTRNNSKFKFLSIK